MIYHLTWESDWKGQAGGTFYRHASLDQEGFIHCTGEREKLLEVAEQFFQPRADDRLLLLSLDESKITASIWWEDPGVGHLFPHVYGPIEIAAVCAVEPLTHTGQHWAIQPPP